MRLKRLNLRYLRNEIIVVNELVLIKEYYEILNSKAAFYEIKYIGINNKKAPYCSYMKCKFNNANECSKYLGENYVCPNLDTSETGLNRPQYTHRFIDPVMSLIMSKKLYHELRKYS